MNAKIKDYVTLLKAVEENYLWIKELSEQGEQEETQEQVREYLDSLYKVRKALRKALSMLAC